MAGHSKWANIKHKKGAEDAKRSKIFQKFSKEIMIAIKQDGNDPSTNARLRLSIEKAKSGNMPNDNIKKLLSKSEKDSSILNELTYEGYGPGGVAVLVSCLTDNTNRTSASLKSTFSKNGGNLGTSGSVSYLFESKGIIVLDSSNYSFDNIMEILLETNILDIKKEDEFIVIETKPSDLISIKEFLISKNIDQFISSEIMKIANNKVSIEEKNLIKLERLIDILEENEDVQDVYTNIE